MPIFTVGAAGTTSTSAYAVDNSLRFSEDSGDYLQNPASGAAVAAERKTLTFSFWVKRAKLGTRSSTQYMICGIEGTGNYYSALMFNSTDQLRFFHYESGTTRCDLKTNRVFRDTSAWYHIVLAIDTNQSTAADRVNIYVNGVKETSFATETYYTSGFNTYFGMTNGTDGYPTYIGSNASSDHFDGYMAEVVGVGGSQLAATDFAESDSDTGTWIPKDLSGLSYGSGVAGNFLLQFQTSGTLGDDTSGNNNDFTVTNLTSVDQSTDTPTNIYATLNNLSNSNSSMDYDEGNLEAISSTSWLGSTSTIGLASGKWYWEVKYVSGNFGTGIGKIGTTSTETNNLSSANNGYIGKYPDGYEYFKNFSNSQKINNNSASSYGSVLSANDVLMIAFDADNGTIWVGSNGTWFSSATQGEIEAGTTTNSMYSGITVDDFFVPTVSIENGTVQFNFGSPLYSISSSNTDGNGYGNFEYAVPSGYYAINSKNLAQYG